MDYRNLSDADLVDLGKSIELVLSDHKVTCFSNDLADELAAALSPINTSFEAVIEECVVVDNHKVSTFQEKRAQRAVELERIATVQRYLVSVGADKKFYDMCGLSYRKTPSPVVPVAPTALSGSGTSNGINDIRWTGNNKTGTVMYEVWRRHGDTVDWYFLKVTKKQRATDTPVTPGQYYEYKVRAVTAQGVMSAWSNSAVVYGAP